MIRQTLRSPQYTIDELVPEDQVSPKPHHPAVHPQTIHPPHEQKLGLTTIGYLPSGLVWSWQVSKTSEIFLVKFLHNRRVEVKYMKKVLKICKMEIDLPS